MAFQIKWVSLGWFRKPRKSKTATVGPPRPSLRVGEGGPSLTEKTTIFLDEFPNQPTSRRWWVGSFEKFTQSCYPFQAIPQRSIPQVISMAPAIPWNISTVRRHLHIPTAITGVWLVWLTQIDNLGLSTIVAKWRCIPIGSMGLVYLTTFNYGWSLWFP